VKKIQIKMENSKFRYILKMEKQLIIIDIKKKKYEVKNFKKFSDHIFKYHSTGVSIHEENGFFFEVDDDFRSKISLYMKNLNL